MMGDAVCKLVYRNQDGTLGEQLLFRSSEADLELLSTGRKWSFQGSGDLFRLVSEAARIELAYLFDPYVAVSSSGIDPLPHQISAVYEHMLPRQPMRFLLADDPGAGKTIMAGLLIKELLIRGELERCLIVAPGSLTEQWQDELEEKFELHFELLSRDLIRATGLANPFEQRLLLIAPMDMLSRDEELQHRLLQAPEWDLLVCDESHRMSAHYFAREVKRTRRYEMGKRVGSHARNLLLMTATPHNGKEAEGGSRKRLNVGFALMTLQRRLASSPFAIQRSLERRRERLERRLEEERLPGAAFRQEMERAMARRIHPHYVQDFFIAAFRRLGGKVHPREKGRYEISHVPPLLLDRNQQIGLGLPLQPRYERICFERELCFLRSPQALTFIRIHY
ncbi:MAG: DEAD/DEAH box helicase [Aphanocapsa feldmannii 277cV]|uniref:DEAD/DEAH box helicase n=1 Tax=Aphanocapsa feldmannii 277cV TaxID=2507553 RepID=A0A524RR41_9CHRO|nr:MAG: DEAD/DEAH box helicase [Aphanocapsa feldmannii 277cV]